MAELYTIKDARTVHCRDRMAAMDGEWNGVTGAWMFGNPQSAANALCELHRATRATPTMRETLFAMIADGTAQAAWDYDPLTRAIDVDSLDRAEAQRLLAAGFAARRVLGIHRLEDREQPLDGDDELRGAAFDERARRSANRNRRGRLT